MPPRTFEMGFDDSPRSWGNSIQWWPDFTSRRVVGWLSHRPVKGDLLRVAMQSGKVAIFKFIEVDLQRDPEDMFFGRVRDVGYEGEPPFARPSQLRAFLQWWRSRRVVDLALRLIQRGPRS